MSWQPRSSRPLQLEARCSQGSGCAGCRIVAHVAIASRRLGGGRITAVSGPAYRRHHRFLAGSPQHRRPSVVGKTRAQHRLPVVVNDDGPTLSQYDRVISDHEIGAYELTSWLLGQGRRRILPLWGVDRERYWVKMREAGYQRAMREAGLEPLPAVYVQVGPPSPAELATRENLGPRHGNTRDSWSSIY